MKVTGVNYPWVNCGWDFGDPPTGWTGGLDRDTFRAVQRANVAKDFTHLRELGMDVVRWFILADGLTYGSGAFAPREDGHFLVLPPGDDAIRSILQDFGEVLDLCASTGVKLIPSLIDFNWCFPAQPAATGYVKCGRASVLTDDIQRTIFLDTVLDPLLEVSRNKPESIYAWEPINEPEWCTLGAAWKVWERADHKKAISLHAMRTYIQESARRINNSGFQSTVGFAHWDTIADWNARDLGISIQQFHYYAQAGAQLPAAQEVTSQPCLVGEFASAPTMPWPNEAQSLDARLRSARELGYEGALVWSMKAVDEATLWNQQQTALLAGWRGVDPEKRDA